ncbi:hypothetical protein QN096_11535 [Metapseudomonas otitidis]|uniref:hypothetical protein n=1 Tax=Metapseudomonas otitidis TaxID=319939 RepID=UPI002540DAF0|nr:hypothetical protein [Pseudomonas otitidis]WIF69733.1 hypothetical protein QN096_11535 [Pseudomonas otitidis]
MDKEVQEKLRAAIAAGHDVHIDIKAHTVDLLRSLADDIERGDKVVGMAELRCVRELLPYFTYVVSVKDS